ncbi:MAG TPA: methyl-accepting chemotaxis protein, partial [Opitutales bacterium]|nr:methyl-accepting chemotaxis protein [Opitutales bacterium]
MTQRPSNRNTEVELRIERLARSSIALSKLAPELTSIASKLASGAQQQASQSREIAANVDRMADELARAMETLNVSSGSVGEIVAAIKRVADQTRILSINASIEAARAGVVGLAFGAVAKEVESLAGQTTSATKQISGKVDLIRDNIRSAVDAAGLGNESGTASARKGVSIRRLGGEVNEMAAIATETAGAARSVDETSSRIRSLCEDLLVEVGAFRLPAHDHAVSVFREILGMEEFATLNRGRCEGAMKKSLRATSIFELLYLTDASGRQVTSNLWS